MGAVTVQIVDVTVVLFQWRDLVGIWLFSRQDHVVLCKYSRLAAIRSPLEGAFFAPQSCIEHRDGNATPHDSALVKLAGCDLSWIISVGTYAGVAAVHHRVVVNAQTLDGLLPQRRELSSVEGGAYGANDVEFTCHDAACAFDSAACELRIGGLHDVVVANAGHDLADRCGCRLADGFRMRGCGSGHLWRRSRLSNSGFNCGRFGPARQPKSNEQNTDGNGRQDPAPTLGDRIHDISRLYRMRVIPSRSSSTV
jgi:hypothetical protein